jgi:hypothetical protein
MLVGSESVPGVIETSERAIAAIPNVRVRWLAGHGHFAHKTDPDARYASARSVGRR